MTENYYTVLEIPRTASQAEIKAAFLRLMRQVHPDLLATAPEYWKKQAEEKSKDITESYQVLSDPEKRRSYDRRLDANEQQPQSAGASQTQPQTSQSVSSSAATWFRRTAQSSPKLPHGKYVASAIVGVLAAIFLGWLLAHLTPASRVSSTANSTVSPTQSEPPNAASNTHSKAASASAKLDGGHVLQWNARTRSWRLAKSSAGKANPAFSPNSSGGVQWYMQWDTQTDSWQKTDPSTGQTLHWDESSHQWK